MEIFRDDNKLFCSKNAKVTKVTYDEEDIVEVRSKH